MPITALPPTPHPSPPPPPHSWRLKPKDSHKAWPGMATWNDPVSKKEKEKKKNNKCFYSSFHAFIHMLIVDLVTIPASPPKVII